MLLIKSLAREFYKQHAGFFLFGLYLLFGVVEPGQVIEFNYALLFSGISSVTGMAIVFTLWFLYSLKAWFFIVGLLRLPRYHFIRETASLKSTVQVKLWLKVYSVVLLPVIVYVIFLAALSLKYQLYWSLFSVVVIFGALIYGLASLSFRLVSFERLRQDRSEIFPDFNFVRRYSCWPLYHLFSQQTLMLLICKFLSFVTFKAVLWMFSDVVGDIRTLLITLLASILCHSALVFNLLRFETHYLSFTRSLPVRVSARFLNWLLVFIVVMVPEWLFFLVAAQYQVEMFFTGLFFGIAGLSFLLTICYLAKLNMESYLKMVLLFFFLTLWAILAHLYLLLTIVLLVSSWLFYFFRFEKIDLRGLE